MADSRRERDLPLVEEFEYVRAVTAEGGSVQVPKSMFGGNLEIANENVLGGIKASAKSETDTQEVKIDPKTGKLYCPPSEVSMATAEKLGGIVAGVKTAEETEEVKIDPNTGKAYVKPSSKLEVATAEKLGGVKAEPKTETYTVEAKIDEETGKLYVPEGEGTPPDDEDITIATVNDAKVLQFKNKTYSSSSYSGLGRTYLRKNMVSGVNVLTQSMLSGANTRYVIQYDYDLKGATISVPSGCVLEFQGGRLNNGTVKGDDSLISGSLRNVLHLVKLTGTWANQSCNLNWWDVKTGTGVDNSNEIQSAFDSAVRIIDVSGIYYISSPVKLPVNKTVRGESKDNNMLHGFCANDNFTGKSVTYDGSSYTTYAMFCTGNNYRTELNNLFIDARHKADFCIEHITGAVTWNIFKMGIFNAKKVGILQYACERAVYRSLFLHGNNVGLCIRRNEYDNSNPFGFSGTIKGMPNIITIDDVYATVNNIGMIVQYGTNAVLSNINTAHNSILGLYIRGVTGVAHLSNFYSEGDACCCFYIDEDGYINNSDGTVTGPVTVNMFPSFSRGKTLQALINKNLDGFSTGKTDVEYNAIVYHRAPLVVSMSTLVISGAFISVKPRGTSSSNESNVLEPTQRTAGGVDSLILFRDRCNVSGRGVTQYMLNGDSGSALLTTFIEHYTSYPSKVNINFENGSRFIRFKTVYKERALAEFLAGGNSTIWKGSASIDSKKSIDYNRNVEKSRYGATSNYDIRSGKLDSVYKGVPLYIQSTKFRQSQYRMMYLSKDKLSEMFGDLREVRIRFYIHVLEDIPSSYIYTSVQMLNSGSNVNNQIIASSTTQTVKAGYYEFDSVVPIYAAASFDQIIVSVRENTNAWDKVAYSDVFFYDPADSQLINHEYEEMHLRRGSTNSRPQGVHYGFTYYDTLLGKGIRHTSNDVWTDDNGNVV